MRNEPNLRWSRASCSRGCTWTCVSRCCRCCWARTPRQRRFSAAQRWCPSEPAYAEKNIHFLPANQFVISAIHLFRISERFHLISPVWGLAEPKAIWPTATLFITWLNFLLFFGQIGAQTAHKLLNKRLMTVYGWNLHHAWLFCWRISLRLCKMYHHRYALCDVGYTVLMVALCDALLNVYFWLKATFRCQNMAGWRWK